MCDAHFDFWLQHPAELGEHVPRVGDVVRLQRELADAVLRAERGLAALHAQPLRVVGDAVAARVEDRVVVAAATPSARSLALRSPRNQKSIEQLFDSPQQARHAIATFAAWLEHRFHALHKPVAEWWPRDAAKTVIRPECQEGTGYWFLVTRYLLRLIVGKPTGRSPLQRNQGLRECWKARPLKRTLRLVVPRRLFDRKPATSNQ